MSRGRAFEVDVAPSLTPIGAGALADASFELFRRGAFSLLVLSAATNVPLFASIAALVLFVRDRGWAWGTVSYFVVLALLGTSGVALAEIFAFVGVLAVGLLYVWAKGDIDWIKDIPEEEAAS